MKIEQIINETTTAGAVSSVAMPLGQTQRRTTENVKGLIPAEKVLKAKKKGPYANSLSEGKEKKPVIEADLQEDDLIIIPGQSKRLKAGFIPKAQDRTDHEVEMAKADLLALYKNTKSVLMCIKDISEDEGLEGWVQEKIIKASDYMNTLAEYFEGKKIQEMTGGVIAAGGVGEGVAEGKFTINAKTGAKLDPRTGVELPPKKQMFAQPKQPKLTLDDVWLKIQSVVSNIYPDGDPIDHLAPWLKKHGIRDFKIGEILDRAAKKNGYKDLYDYWESMGDLPLSEQGVAEGLLDRFKKKTQQPEDPSYKKGWELCNKDPSADPQFLFRKFGGGLDRNQFMKGFNDNAKSRGMKLRGDVGSNELTHGDIKYKEFKRDRGMMEDSGPQVGDEVYYGNRLVGWFKGYSKLGKIITEPNVDEMGDEYLSKDAYWDPQDKITIKSKQGVAEGMEQAQLSPEIIQTVQDLRKKLSRGGNLVGKLQAKKTMLVLKTDKLSQQERKLVSDTLTQAGITFKIKDNRVESIPGSWTNTLIGIPYAQGVAESTLTEKAKSTAQQKFFGMAHAMQKGKKIPGASKELKDVAKSMKKSDVKDFAKTKHKDLPSQVKKEK